MNTIDLLRLPVPLILLCLAACGGGDSTGPATAPNRFAAAVTASAAPADGRIDGEIQGLDGKPATVVVGNELEIRTAVVGADGRFSVAGLPDGVYFVKAEAAGFTLSQPLTVVIGPITRPPLPNEPPPLVAGKDAVVFLAKPAGSDTYSYRWSGDASVAGYELAAAVNTPVQVKFLNETVPVADSAAAARLQHDYNIILSNEEGIWNQEYAARVLATMATIPQATRDPYRPNTLKPSKWVLTERAVADDLDVSRLEAGDTVTLSAAALRYATPQMVLLDGVRGQYFSKRLHHALVRYVTRDGADPDAVERILGERYGVTTRVPDYVALTRSTTSEDAARFTAFRPAELVEIINMFEEMPDGFHAVKGLRYLVRRAFGQPNPRYPASAAVAWPGFMAESYIEFMDSAFLDLQSTRRLIIHEKTHFLWELLFGAPLRADWAALGGWQRDVRGEWFTTKSTEFVSAYAHSANPNEDMAESVAAYILNPDVLRSRSPAKYAFVRDRVMQGDRYVAQIRDDLTFQVYNLAPDYHYPGRIQKLAIDVQGRPEADKLVTVKIELAAGDPRFPGAVRAYTRVLSEIGTYVDVYLSPQNAAGTVLSGSFSLSRYAKAGNWMPTDIVLTDQAGNQRYEGRNDFGWKLVVDNPLEIVGKAGYVAHTMKLTVLPQVTANGHTTQKVVATWQIAGNAQLSRFIVYAALVNAQAGGQPYQAYGTYDPATHTATVEFELSEYAPSGVYSVPFIHFWDEAFNQSSVFFSDSPTDEARQSVPIRSDNDDVAAPELDVNRLSVTAAPTSPAAPDGETLVKIVYYARDDKSGLGVVSYRLLDPQGGSHFDYHYHANFYTQRFEGDPVAWTRYEIQVLLPRGSAPGMWGLQEMNLADKVGNHRGYNFVETMHFTVAR
jgi:hypothetical protein